MNNLPPVPRAVRAGRGSDGANIARRIRMGVGPCGFREESKLSKAKLSHTLLPRIIK